MVEGLPCYLPMRLVLIGKPHVHHEGISIIGASDLLRAGLRFQFHGGKRHLPEVPGQIGQEDGSRPSPLVIGLDARQQRRAEGESPKMIGA